MITELFPILSTPDVHRALGFYRDLLGGRVTYEFPGPDGEAAYVGIEIGASHLGIGVSGEAPGARDDRRGWSLWVYTADCDGLVDQLRTEGVTIVEEPADQPWGERVARVLDPDGNEVIIGERQGS
jgi:lactoylglutathione lyase